MNLLLQVPIPRDDFNLRPPSQMALFRRRGGVLRADAIIMTVGKWFERTWLIALFLFGSPASARGLEVIVLPVGDTPMLEFKVDLEKNKAARIRSYKTAVAGAREVTFFARFGDLLYFSLMNRDRHTTRYDLKTGASEPLFHLSADMNKGSAVSGSTFVGLRARGYHSKNMIVSVDLNGSPWPQERDLARKRKEPIDFIHQWDATREDFSGAYVKACVSPDGLIHFHNCAVPDDGILLITLDPVVKKIVRQVPYTADCSWPDSSEGTSNWFDASMGAHDGKHTASFTKPLKDRDYTYIHYGDAHWRRTATWDVPYGKYGIARAVAFHDGALYVMAARRGLDGGAAFLLAWTDGHTPPEDPNHVIALGDGVIRNDTSDTDCTCGLWVGGDVKTGTTVACPPQVVKKTFEPNPYVGFKGLNGNRVRDGWIELFPNGGFEEGEPEVGKVPKNWYGDGLALVEEKRATGRFVLHWSNGGRLSVMPENADGVPNDLVSPLGPGGKNLRYMLIYPDVEYRLKFRARGEGSFRVALAGLRYTRNTFLGMSDFHGDNTVQLTSEWKEYSFRLKKYLGTANLNNHAYIVFKDAPKSKTGIFIDDLSLACRATPENLALYRPELPLQGRIGATDVMWNLYMNGRVVKVQAGGRLEETVGIGTTDIVLELRGKTEQPVNARGSLTIGAGTPVLLKGSTIPVWPAALPPDEPKTIALGDGTWYWTVDRSQAFETRWLDADLWQRASGDGDHVRIPASRTGDGTVYLRRTVYFNGPKELFICPDQPEFHIATGLVTIYKIFLRNFTPVWQDGGVIEIEVPEEIVLLDKTGSAETGPKYPINVIPRVRETRFTRDGLAYRRYTLHYPLLGQRKGQRMNWSQDVLMKSASLLAGLPMSPLYFMLKRRPEDDKVRTFRIRRTFRNGNASQVWRSMRIVFQPEPRGPQPKQARLYIRYLNPWYLGWSSDRRQSKAERLAGFRTIAKIGPAIWQPGINDMELKTLIEKTDGQSYALPETHNPGRFRQSPFWKGFYTDHPDFAIKLYSGSAEVLKMTGKKSEFSTWNSVAGGKAEDVGYCPTKLTAQAPEAWKRFEQHIVELRKDWPDSSFAHDEEQMRFGYNACFCESCKTGYEAWSRIDGAAKMTDEQIVLGKNFRSYMTYLATRELKIREMKHQLFNKYGIHYLLHEEGIQKSFFSDIGHHHMVAVCDTYEHVSHVWPESVAQLTAGAFSTDGKDEHPGRSSYRAALQHGASLSGKLYGRYFPEARELKNTMVRACAIGRCGVISPEMDLKQMLAGGAYYAAEGMSVVARFEFYLCEGMPVPGFRTRLLDETAGRMETVAWEKDGRFAVLVFNDYATAQRVKLAHPQQGKLSGTVDDGKDFAELSEETFTIPAYDVLALELEGDHQRQR